MTTHEPRSCPDFPPHMRGLRRWRTESRLKRLVRELWKPTINASDFFSQALKTDCTLRMQ